MSWRVARSLDQLLAQINAAYPNRSKAADGSIGDAAHAASVSDHNPDPYGIVRARDFTHDPAHGFDAHATADRLIASRDPRIKYVISRGRIASATIAPWTWRTYTGSNPHDHHAHVSVVPDARADDTRPWALTAPIQTPKKEWYDMPIPKADLDAITQDVWTHGGAKGRTIWKTVVDTHASVVALTAAVGALAKAQGLDAAAVQASIDEAVKEALTGLSITLTTPEEGP